MEIESFLPQYPSVDRDDVFQLYDDEAFGNAIFRKQEFYEQKLGPTPPTERPAQGELLQHQELMTRFLGSHTLFNEMLLYHFPGTGKTCNAIGVVESLFAAPDPSIKRALVLVNNKDLMRRFINEIAFVCTKGQYLPTETEDDLGVEDEDAVRDESESDKRYRRAKRNVQERYALYTHQTFHDNVLRAGNRALWSARYSNTVIVIDEAHNISNSQTMYPLYHEFLHALENRKIMLLTGTPMRDDAAEIGPILNLILPDTQQLPVSRSLFHQALVSRDAEGIPSLNETGIETLTRACRGRTSFLRSATSIPVRYVGAPLAPVRFFDIVPSTMSPTQLRVYDRVYTADSGWYNEAQQASLFVFPDGSYGADGFRTHVTVRSSGRFATSYSADFLRGIAVLPTIEAKLNAVAQYSAKYARVLRSIVVDGPAENCFVYTESIREGGAIMFGLCLELFGFHETKSANVRGNHERYTILSSDEGSGSLKDLVRLFNRPNNASGKKLRVLIGGRQIAEGLTFKNVQQIHVLTPHYNYAQIDQAIARGIRAFSHPQLPEGTPVQVFLHAAITGTDTPSIDLRIYDIAEKKDILIKQVERVIKKASYDCALTYDRNRVVGEMDGSRACDYMACAYRCNGVPYPYTVAKADLDHSTSQLYYQDMLQMTTWFQRLFRSRFAITLEELVTNPEGYTPMSILACASHLMQSHTPFVNRYGFRSYLHHKDNVFFLADTVVHPTPFLDAFYTQYPVVRYTTTDTFRVLLQRTSIAEDERITASLCGMSLEEQQTTINAMSPRLQRQVVQQTIAAVEDSPMRRWVRQRFASHISEREGGRVVLMELGGPPIEFHRGAWRTVTHTPRQDLVAHPLGVYGELKSGKFRIVDLRGVPEENRRHQSTKRGKDCKSFKKPALIQLMLYLGIPVPEGAVLPVVDPVYVERQFKDYTLPDDVSLYPVVQYWLKTTLNTICSTLHDWFKSNDMLMQR